MDLAGQLIEDTEVCFLIPVQARLSHTVVSLLRGSRIYLNVSFVMFRFYIVRLKARASSIRHQ